MARNGLWRLLRMALLWARRVGALKRATFADFVCGGGEKKNRYMLYYREHEFSFGSTPLFRLGGGKKQWSAIKALRSISCFGKDVEEEEEEEEEEDIRGAFSVTWSDATTATAGGGMEDDYFGDVEEESGEEEEDVDARAEVFIAGFYEQLKLQRQRSRALIKYRDD